MCTNTHPEHGLSSGSIGADVNWNLVPSQFYGLILFLILGIGAFLLAVLAAAWTLYQINRSRNQDLDERIKAAAKLEISAVEAQLNSLKQGTESHHREQMTFLTELEKRLPKAESVHDHTARLDILERAEGFTNTQIELLFRRTRRLELAFARQSGIEFEDDTTLTNHEPPPPRSR